MNSAIRPPGADGRYHFPVAEGVTLYAHDKSGLIDAIYAYRIRHGGATDTIEREIDDYYCSKWPTACVKEPSDYGHANPKQTRSGGEALLHRVSRWATMIHDRMPRGGYQLVTLDEANRRQNICTGCEMNRAWRTGCRGCTGALAGLLAQVRGLRKPAGDALGCMVAGWENVTSASLPISALPLSDAEKTRLPDKCWRKI